MKSYLSALSVLTLICAFNILCSLSFFFFFAVVVVQRVRDSLRRVDPIGTEVRALANRTLRRRQYSVPAPNAMWHIDGNHKLIRYFSKLFLNT